MPYYDSIAYTIRKSPTKPLAVGGVLERQKTPFGHYLYMRRYTAQVISWGVKFESEDDYKNLLPGFRMLCGPLLLIPADSDVPMPITAEGKVAEAICCVYELEE